MIRNNQIVREFDDIYPPWMPVPFSQPSTDSIKNTLSVLTKLPSIRVRFSADKNSRNETGTYPDKVSEGVKNWKTKFENN